MFLGSWIQGFRGFISNVPVPVSERIPRRFGVSHWHPASSREHAAAIKAAGFDICCHGYRWENHFDMSKEQERARIAAAVTSITKTMGSPPAGWCASLGWLDHRPPTRGGCWRELGRAGQVLPHGAIAEHTRTAA